jgi:hypothetical protein
MCRIYLEDVLVQQEQGWGTVVCSVNVQRVYGA